MKISFCWAYRMRLCDFDPVDTAAGLKIVAYTVFSFWLSMFWCFSHLFLSFFLFLFNPSEPHCILFLYSWEDHNDFIASVSLAAQCAALNRNTFILFRPTDPLLVDLNSTPRLATFSKMKGLQKEDRKLVLQNLYRLSQNTHRKYFLSDPSAELQ